MRRAPEAELVPRPGISAAVAAVEEGKADEAILPIENSLEGAVTQTLDLLVHSTRLSILAELVLPVHHCLALGTGVRRENAQVVYSHPQALAQCRSYLERRLPSAVRVASLSTADAVRDLLASARPAAAISSERAAAHYGARVSARRIEDAPGNETRFVVLAPRDAPPTGDDRTSVCFDFSEDRAGSLHGALGEFAERGINLMKIESRPDKKSLGRYFFFVDVDGHRTDPELRAALDGLRARVSVFRMLGSYPHVPRR